MRLRGAVPTVSPVSWSSRPWSFPGWAGTQRRSEPTRLTVRLAQGQVRAHVRASRRSGPTARWGVPDPWVTAVRSLDARPADGVDRDDYLLVRFGSRDLERAPCQTDTGRGQATGDHHRLRGHDHRAAVRDVYVAQKSGGRKCDVGTHGSALSAALHPSPSPVAPAC